MSVLQHNLSKATLNASNINAIAAALFSVSFGSIPGTIIFVFAATIGTLNKYKTLKEKKYHKNFLVRELSDPSITAKILMIAAGINTIANGWNLLTYDENLLYYFILTSAWGFGFLGDDMLRRNDKTNFSQDIKKGKEQNLWLRGLWITVRDPLLYYIICNIFFTLAVLIEPSGEMTFVLKSLATSIIFISLLAIFYSFFRAIRIVKGDIDIKKAHNGTIAFCGVGINFILTIMALLQGLPWIFAAQILFCLSNIMIFFETRHALKRENI
jgi:protein-S-isoprenylcysteine O-methyltransferase Ste14